MIFLQKRFDQKAILQSFTFLTERAFPITHQISLDNISGVWEKLLPGSNTWEEHGRMEFACQGIHLQAMNFVDFSKGMVSLSILLIHSLTI